MNRKLKTGQMAPDTAQFGDNIADEVDKACVLISNGNKSLRYILS